MLQHTPVDLLVGIFLLRFSELQDEAGPVAVLSQGNQLHECELRWGGPEC